MEILSKALEKEVKKPFPFYIINGDCEKNKEDVLFFLNNDLNFLEKKNPDFYDFKELSFSIDSAREIKKINSLSKNNKNSFRVFFIETKKIEEVSQNALLKTLEEPQENTIFFLFIEDLDLILDTLKSRARIISGNEKKSTERASEFVNGDYVSREKMIEKILKKYTNEKENKSQKTKEDFLNLFSEIEVIFLENINSEEFTKERVLELSKFYKTFLDLKSQAKQNGSGIKNIFIYLAVFLPKV
jgi:DNA polymerase III delta prime subunit